MTSEQRARKDTVGAGDGAAVYRPRPVVLAIDDEPGVRESLRLILGDEFEVLEAADGAAALAILGARRSTWPCSTCGCLGSLDPACCRRSWPSTRRSRSS